MKNWMLLAAGMSLGLAGCATGGIPLGGLVSSVSTPITATSNPTGTREGEACATTLLGLVSFGDASIDLARRNGAISMISTVDMRYSGVPIIFMRSCTVVRGR